MVELRTARLLLRELREADREPFARMNADPLVMEHFPRTLTRAESDALLDRIGEHHREHGWGLWGVERRDTGELVGFTGLTTVRFETAFTPAVEVGWRLDAAHWGQGFATEAATEALRYGFEVVGLERVVSFTARSNVRSQAVMRRIGMQPWPAWDFDHPSVPEGSPLRYAVVYRLDRP